VYRITPMSPVIPDPRVTPVGSFCSTICEELGLPIEAKERDSVKQMVDG